LKEIKSLKLLLPLLIFISAFVKAEDKGVVVIDSLKVELKKATTDQERIDVLIELGDKYADLNSDSLISVANQLVILCEKVNNKCGLSSAFGFKGYYYYKNSELKDAQILYEIVVKKR